jgi:hypothetical protein
MKEFKPMILQGHICNGVIVLDEAAELPEGAAVRVELIESSKEAEPERRQGGQYAGRIWMATNFDQWPIDLQEALGMTP